MVETCHLQPPVSGPQSDPLLFGVAEALALLFPVDRCERRDRAEPSEPPEHEPVVEEALAA